MAINSIESYGPLSKYEKSITSQAGEDGIIEEIFRRLNIEKGWFVELGALDGIDISNTRSLYLKGWDGVLIESNANYSERMNNNSPKTHNIIGRVNTEEGTRLDDYLDKTPIPNDFDLLSLDIDSLEYWVWKSLKRQPKVVCVEFNCIHRYPIAKTVAYDANLTFVLTNYFGASCGALDKLGKEKGYTCVAAIDGLNLFFVKNEYANLFEPFDMSEIACHDNFDQDPTRRMIEV